MTRFGRIFVGFVAALLICLVAFVVTHLDDFHSTTEATRAIDTDGITKQSDLDSFATLIRSNGYYCPRAIGGSYMGLDGSFGPTFNIVCPGDTVTGTRYRVSNPSPGVHRVRVGW